MENLEEAPAISSVSLMELYYGAFNKTEIKHLDKFASLFELLPISKAISFKAAELVRDYSKSHNLDIPDSLIAATALVNHCKLLTYNIRDFRFIRNWS
ncbi:MAG: type II toxin-antitoxin system VapC family toxin [Pseudomonadota bacterium]|nr:type II toxin-antitoxin system VapC family toxin [Pseudomonadota bacterium]